NRAKLNAVRLGLALGTQAGTETVNAQTAQRFIDGQIVVIPGVWSPNGQFNTGADETTCRASNDTTKFDEAMTNWLGPQKSWLISKERYIILNIANEWGDDDTLWRDKFKAAVQSLRTAGVKA